MSTKIIHIGDIHLGMTKLNLDRSNEEDYILNFIIKEVEKINPDIIIINGDITDHPTPTGEKLLKKIVRFFISLKQRCNRLIINHGNHDWIGLSSIEALSDIVDIDYITEPTQIEYKNIMFDVVPYIDIRKQFKTSPEPFKAAFDAFLSMLYDFDNYGKDRNLCRVFVNHGSIEGTLDVDENFDREIQISPDLLKTFYDLAIMSHIHSRSCIDDFIWYAGSPMTCTFGEKDYPTGFLVHEINEYNHINTYAVNTPAIQFETLEFGEKTFDEIKEDIKQFITNYPNKYVKVVINTIVPSYGKTEIKKLSPNIISIQLKKQDNQLFTVDKKDAVEKKDFVKLFESFLSTQKGDNKKVLEKFKKTLEEMQ